MTAKTRNEELWTPANIVTLLRICGVPVFVVALISPWPIWFGLQDVEVWKEWIAAGIFIVLAATDGLDGYLARSRDEVTNFGKFMDPLADKILIAAALLALIELGVLPSWVALTILCREFIVSGIRMVAATQGVVIAASWYGKAKTVAQIIAVVLFIIKDNTMVSDLSHMLSNRLYLLSWAVMAVALVLTIVSMLDYFVKAKRILGFDADSNEQDDGQAGHGKVGPLFVKQALDAKGLDDLASRVLDKARAGKKMLATAESCTGGMVAAQLTAIAGSSEAFAGSIVSYTNDVKEASLGVRRETLESYGAVSEQTACAMAHGARNALSADIAVSLTGIAGPQGGSEDKPVGTVWIGLATSQGVSAVCYHFDGNREEVRLQAVRAALLTLEDALGN